MKSFVRDLLLTLFIAMIAFSAIAFFLVGFAEGLMGDVVNKIGQVETGEQGFVTGEEIVTGENPNGGGTVQNGNAAIFLLIGLDQQNQR